MKKARFLFYLIIPILIAIFYLNERIPFVDRDTANEMPAVISRINIYKESIKNFQFPPIYSDQHFRGEAFSLLNLQVIPFFLIGLFSLIFNTVIAIKLFFLITIFASGYFFYIFVKDEVGDLPALFAGFLYQTTPQFILHIDLMGQISVPLFMVLIPLALLMVKKFPVKERKIKNYLILIGLNIILFFTDNERNFVFIPFFLLFFYLKNDYKKLLKFIGVLIVAFIPIAIYILIEKNNFAFHPKNESIVLHYSLRNILFLFNRGNIFGFNLYDPKYFEADIKYLLLIPTITFFLIPFIRRCKKGIPIFFIGLLYLNFSQGYYSSLTNLFKGEYLAFILVVSYLIILFFLSKIHYLSKIITALFLFIPLFPIIHFIPPFNFMRAPINFFDSIMPFIVIYLFVLLFKNNKKLVILFTILSILDGAVYFKYFGSYEPKEYVIERQKIDQIMDRNDLFYSFTPFFNESNFNSKEAYSNIFSYLAFRYFQEPFGRLNNFNGFMKLLQFCGTEYVVFYHGNSNIPDYKKDIRTKSALFNDIIPIFSGNYLNLYKMENSHDDFMIFPKYLYIKGKGNFPMELYMLENNIPLIHIQANGNNDVYTQSKEPIYDIRKLKEMKGEKIKISYRFIKKKRNYLTYKVNVPEDGFIKTTFSYSKHIKIIADGKRIKNYRTSFIFSGFFIKRGTHFITVKYIDLFFDIIFYLYFLILFGFIIIILLWKEF